MFDFIIKLLLWKSRYIPKKETKFLSFLYNMCSMNLDEDLKDVLLDLESSHNLQPSIYQLSDLLFLEEP
ncbi:MAG: hypothetical protein DRG69_09655 [Deltaproteobacteria bacterium]|nr:MAG: hypothetical protein DRG69_09655 [Deltaproteobacteria bacterium]